MATKKRKVSAAQIKKMQAGLRRWRKSQGKTTKKSGGSMSKKKRKSSGGSKSAKRKSSGGGTSSRRGGRRRSGGGMKSVHPMAAVLLGAGSGIVGAVVANKVPVKNDKVKAALPGVAGAGLAFLGIKKKMPLAIAASIGLMTLSAIAMIRRVAPTVPLLAGETEDELALAYGYGRQPQEVPQLQYMGEPVDIAQDDEEFEAAGETVDLADDFEDDIVGDDFEDDLAADDSDSIY